MWDSNGDIDGESMTVVDPGPGDMRVSGAIRHRSFVFLVSTGGSIVVDGPILEDSTVILVSTSGAIEIGVSISGSDVSLKAASGILIGLIGVDVVLRDASGGGKVWEVAGDAPSQVSAEAGGDITVCKIDGSSVSLRSHGDITIDGDITGDKSNVWQIADGAIRGLSTS